MSSKEAETSGDSLTLLKKTEEGQIKNSQLIAGNVPNVKIICKFCSQEYLTHQECMRHELLQHSHYQKKRTSAKTLRSRAKTVKNFIKSDEFINLLRKTHLALSKCPPGEEIGIAIKFHQMNSENLDIINTLIQNSLEEELCCISPLEIFAFGSVASGLALRDSDIDFYVDASPKRIGSKEEGTEYYQRYPSQNCKTLKMFNKVNSMLERSPRFTDVYAIRNARVPIIKCKHSATGFNLDINLTCPSSVHNTNFLRDLSQCDKRLRETMVFLKIWAKHIQLIRHAGISSYCLTTLIIFFLQQSHSTCPALIPSINQMQANITPVWVLGVNYAYDLKTHMKPIRKNLKSLDLIKGFFTFYSEFDFENLIIAPFLGAAIPISLFKSGEFKYHAYECQLKEVTRCNNISLSAPLQVNRNICVQDPFCLNHNVAKSASPTFLQHMHNCFRGAVRTCHENASRLDSQLIESLLFGIMEQMTCTLTLKNDNQKEPNPHKNRLYYRLTPGRTELRQLFIETNNSEEKQLFRLWIKYYIQVIVEILTDVYRFELQIVSPKQDDGSTKQPRQKDEDLSYVWLISSSIDLWTGRVHQRNRFQSFMDFQIAQTIAFLRQRSQKSDYAVNVSAILTVNIICEHTEIEVLLEQRDGTSEQLLSKSNALNKFFAVFKNSLQNYNLKEKFLGRAFKKQ